MSNPDTWNPQQYQKFEKERNEPFFDLLKLINVLPKMNVVDLGCGTGNLTLILHETLKAKSTLGIDSSAAMLKEAPYEKYPNLQFQRLAIENFVPSKKYDLIISNAALQWLPDHIGLFNNLSRYLAKGAQIAVQMPANFDFPTHTIARELSLKMPFSEHLNGAKVPGVMPIEEYAKILYNLGAVQQHVRAQVYAHVLESTDSAIEWVKGSLLTFYQERLPSELYQEFLRQYIKEMKMFFGDKKPFFLPFKRILIWGQFK